MLWFCNITIATIWGQSVSYTKSTELGVGIGHMEYMNTVAVPSGLPGLSTQLEYCQTTINKLNPQLSFEFTARADYAHLIRSEYNNGINYPYHHGEISVGSIMSLQTKEVLPNLNIKIGGGLLFHSMLSINPLNFSSELHYFGLYGNWFLSPTIRLELGYKVRNILLQTKFTMPILMIGFFQEFQNYPFKSSDQLLYFITPNTCVLPTKYLQAKVDISAYIPLVKSKSNQLDFKIGYYFDGSRSNINYNTEHKRNQGICFGIVIEK
jgi:hypothetical protein